MKKQNIRLSQSKSVKYPTEERYSDLSKRPLTGWRIDFLGSKEGSFAGFEQETLYIPEETMNNPTYLKRLLGEVAYQILVRVRNKNAK